MPLGWPKLFERFTKAFDDHRPLQYLYLYSPQHHRYEKADKRSANHRRRGVGCIRWSLLLFHSAAETKSSLSAHLLGPQWVLPLAKTMEKDRFPWSQNGEEAQEITEVQLKMLEKRFGRIDIALGRQTMSSWTRRAYQKLKILEEFYEEQLKAGLAINIDETTVQVMGEKDKSDTSKSYMWLARGGSVESPILLCLSPLPQCGVHLGFSPWLRRLSPI